MEAARHPMEHVSFVAMLNILQHPLPSIADDGMTDKLSRRAADGVD
jgi:hypothetical protein